MVHSVRVWLGLDKHGVSRRSEPQHRTLYLDDVVGVNPVNQCYSCHSPKIMRLGTHNPDGYDFKCNSCGRTYEVCLDDDYHH